MVCTTRRRLAAAARLYEEAFRLDPDMPGDIEMGYGHEAACVAVLAAEGKGVEKDTLDAEEKTRFRALALAWLEADLVARKRASETGKQQHRIRRWRYGPKLASVRESGPLAKLPEEERTAWQAFWHQVNGQLNQE